MGILKGDLINMVRAYPYFDGECEKIIDGMDRGELSKICQQAVKEYASSSEDIEVLKKKLMVIEEEKNKIDAQHDFIKKRYDKLKGEKEAIEKEELRKERKSEEEKEERLEGIKNTFLEYANNFGLSKKEKEEQLPDFLEQWLKGQPRLGAIHYIEKKNPGRTWKKKK